MRILNNKAKILKLLIIFLVIITIIIILNSNIKLFQSDDYIFLKIFQKTNNENKIDYDNTESEENYIFKVDLKNIDIKQIDLMKTVNKTTCLNKKIAPGTSGNFNILLETNKDSKYKIYFQSVNEKPQNLYFKAIKDGKEIKPDDVKLKVTVTSQGTTETAYDSKVSPANENVPVKVSGKGTVIIKVYIDGVLGGREYQLNLNSNTTLTVE